MKASADLRMRFALAERLHKSVRWVNRLDVVEYTYWIVYLKLRGSGG
jgi:hypothetical protein